MNRENSSPLRGGTGGTFDMGGAEFALAPALAVEAAASVDLPLSRLILRDDARLPWVVLVPRRAEVSETFDLLPGDRQALFVEIDRVGQALKAATGALKINTAAFGNIAPQLHIHILARSEGDPFWPGSAIGVGERVAYSSSDGPDTPDWWSGLLDRLSDLTNP